MIGIRMLAWGHMHPIQQTILDLAERRNLGKMSLRDIGREATGKDQAPQKVKYHLDQLVKSGYLLVDKKRGLIERVSQGESRSGFASLPIVGAANCGPATAIAEENVEGYLQLSKTITGRDPSNLFVIRAVGNSMNKARIGDDGLSIQDGDFIVVNGKDRSPKNGDYVLSVIDGLANVKRFHKEQGTGQISLLSESTEECPPIFIHANDDAEYFVAGKVKYVLKKPKRP